eukprot:SAG31_NODE_199_length_20573_cov_5.832129_19_plen_1292_part_00
MRLDLSKHTAACQNWFFCFVRRLIACLLTVVESHGRESLFEAGNIIHAECIYAKSAGYLLQSIAESEECSYASTLDINTQQKNTDAKESHASILRQTHLSSTQPQYVHTLAQTDAAAAAEIRAVVAGISIDRVERTMRAAQSALTVDKPNGFRHNSSTDNASPEGVKSRKAPEKQPLLSPSQRVDRWRRAFDICAGEGDPEQFSQCDEAKMAHDMRQDSNAEGQRAVCQKLGSELRLFRSIEEVELLAGGDLDSVELKESFAVFADLATGLPCLGPDVRLRQLEPPPQPGAEDEVDLLNATKVTIGPLTETTANRNADEANDDDNADDDNTQPLAGPQAVWELSWVEEDAMQWRQVLQILKELTDGSTTRSAEARLQAPQQVGGGSGEHRTWQTCSSDMLTFTVPPAICKSGGAFFIRARFGVDSSLVFSNNFVWTQDGIADERGWINPLTWRNGEHFAPRFRQHMQYFIRTDTLEALPPPPVVFSDKWESAHIVNTVNKGAARQQVEGDLRLFSLTGLIPSCTPKSAKMMGYGLSRVEVQVTGVTGMTWGEANRPENDRLWSSTLVYDVPKEGFFNVLTTAMVNALRFKGLASLEESIQGHMDRNRTKNAKMIKEFVEECWEKLQPWYAYRMEPWLASHTVTQLLVDETRETIFRNKARSLLRALSVSIPAPLQCDKPMIAAAQVCLEDGTVLMEWTANAGLTTVDQGTVQQTPDGTIGVQRDQSPTLTRVPEGCDFFVHGEAKRSEWGIMNVNSIDALQSDTVQSRGRQIQLWWRILRASTPLDLHDEELLVTGTESMNVEAVEDQECSACILKRPGGRVHSPPRSAAEAHQSFLHFRGVHEGTLFPVLQQGAELVLELTVVEEGAHETSSVDIPIEIVEPSILSSSPVMDSATGTVVDLPAPSSGIPSPVPSPSGGQARADENEINEDVRQAAEGAQVHSASPDTDAESEPKWPPLKQGTPPTVEQLLARIPYHLETLIVQQIRDRLFSLLQVPQPWGNSLADSPGWNVISTAVGKSVLRQLKIALAQSQLPDGWSAQKRLQWTREDDPRLSRLSRLRSRAEGADDETREEQNRASPPNLRDDSIRAGSDDDPSHYISDAGFVDEMIAVLGEIVKLRCVEIFQKRVRKLRKLERLDRGGVLEHVAQKAALARRILETDEQAERCEAKVSMDDLRSQDVIDIGVMVGKRVLKMEAKEFLIEEVKPLRPCLLMFGFIILCLIIVGTLQVAFPSTIHAPAEEQIGPCFSGTCGSADNHACAEQLSSLRAELAAQRALLEKVLRQVSNENML